MLLNVSPFRNSNSSWAGEIVEKILASPKQMSWDRKFDNRGLASDDTW